MIYSVYDIKLDRYVFSGTLKECKEYISLSDHDYLLEIRGGL